MFRSINRRPEPPSPTATSSQGTTFQLEKQCAWQAPPPSHTSTRIYHRQLRRCTHYDLILIDRACVIKAIRFERFLTVVEKSPYHSLTFGRRLGTVNECNRLISTVNFRFARQPGLV